MRKRIFKSHSLNISIYSNTVSVLSRNNSWKLHIRKKTNSVAFSPQANYTDWAKAAGVQILVPTFEDRGVSSDQNGSTPRPLISEF
jgi:hypothetical protein